MCVTNPNDKPITFKPIMPDDNDDHGPVGEAGESEEVGEEFEEDEGEVSRNRYGQII